ncbi:MAG: hypothetical protein QME81_13105 [bacterium]|nr:hypothetical protein [bacterium]
MEIVMGIMGMCLTVLGLIFGYIWKSNGQLQKSMMTALERIEQGQERMEQRMEQGQQRMEQGQERLAQMLLNQTKILEKIEGKIPVPVE